MGQRTDAAIANWQKMAGLVPASRARGEDLTRMQELALELIRVIELERAGIRDGDGFWYGSDPLRGIAHDLAELLEADQRARRHGQGVTPS
jgi:hypothetical protein